MPAFHFDADPDPTFLFDADPDAALHFDADLNPNPTFHFDADLTCQNDADLCGSGSTTLLLTAINGRMFPIQFSDRNDIKLKTKHPHLVRAYEP